MPSSKPNVKRHVVKSTVRRTRTTVMKDGKKVHAKWGDLKPKAKAMASQGNNQLRAAHDVPFGLNLDVDGNVDEAALYDDTPHFMQNEDQRPSYAAQKSHRNQRWHQELPEILRDLRIHLFPTVSGQVCSSPNCNSPATSRCLNCRDLGPMCEACSVRIHTSVLSKTHITQSVSQINGTDIWTANAVPPWGSTIVLECNDIRHHTHETTITFIQEQGQRDIVVNKCRCSSWPQALIRLGYWPTSPKQPRTFLVLSCYWMKALITIRIGSLHSYAYKLPRSESYMSCECIHLC